MTTPQDDPGFTHRYGPQEAAGQHEPTQVFAASGPPPGVYGAPYGAPYGGGYGGGQPPIGPTGSPSGSRRRRGGMIVAAALLAGALAGVGGAAGYEALDGPSTSTTASSAVTSSLDTRPAASTTTTGSVESVANKLLPSVVQINVAGQQGAGNGTGIVLSKDGLILTNNHVVELAASGGSITVLLNDGSVTKASIVGRDPLTDIAVIKAAGVSNLTPASLGSSSNLAVGQQVVAIGSPFGLESTVTTGIVSALNRPVTTGSDTGSTSTVFPGIQTDAAINPGNSGGPLVDMAGNVIGINSAIQTDTSSMTGSQGGSIGLGFAIPIDLARAIANQLAHGQTPTHAKIGVSVSDDVQSDHITTTGAVVRQVTAGSAGQQAGLRVGDVITGVDHQAVTSSDGLVALIRSHRPGDTVMLTYERNGSPHTTDVTLDSDGGSLTP
ncbi:MAG: S1C family serine protease [Nocardioidaceae bacterium]